MDDEDVRVRLTGSLYTTKKSVSNTIYSGDRAGSRFYSVLENTASTEAAQAWSGAVQPGFKSKVTAMQLNPFVKIGGVELFGVIENAKGKAVVETKDREWNQYAVDAVRYVDELPAVLLLLSGDRDLFRPDHRQQLRQL